MEGRAARRVGLGYGQLRGRREQGERGGVPTEDVVLADIFLLGREAPLLRRSNVADGQPWSVRRATERPSGPAARANRAAALWHYGPQPSQVTGGSASPVTSSRTYWCTATLPTSKRRAAAAASSQLSRSRRAKRSSRATARALPGVRGPGRSHHGPSYHGHLLLWLHLVRLVSRRIYLLWALLA